ncbi:MAG: carboxypeptidase-like regulatory domain-containing protein [Chitinophagaceae bacterium]|nr:carboxypeptidase-like regulatory domain-containing protein [Chitinophagaceae bacterium]
MRKILLLLFIIIAIRSSAQKIHGVVFSDKGDLLPYSSITLKGTTIGASANNRAKYAINVKPGTYTLVCQHIGYAAQEKKVTVTANDEEVIFTLNEQKLALKEVVIKNGEDPAYQIIRAAIKKRPVYNKEVNAFTCDLYTKDMIKLRRLPKRILGQRVPDEDRKDMGLDTTGVGIIYLSESLASVASQKPDNFKLEVKSSRVSGSDGFGFTFPTFISLYQNNVILFTQKLNPRGFISPIADGALNYYRYKYLGSFWEDGKEINSIRVTPKREYEPLFSGIINITENDWRIHSLDLVLTKKSQLEIIDTLQVTQFHVPVTNDTWRAKNQLIHFNFSQFGIDAVGNFVSVYSNYNLQPVFAKDFFDNVIIKYDTGVNKKPKAYWDTIRPVPLEKEEARDYVVKDSLFEVNKDSAKSQLAADVLNAKQGKINPLDIFWGGVRRTHYTKEGSYSWSFNPLIKELEYNPAEGLVINAAGSYRKYLKEAKTNLTISPNLRYGISNQHFNGWLEVNLRTRDYEPQGKLKRQSWTFSGGRRVTQFNRESPIMPLINTISTLFYGDNFMKTYENVFGNIIYSKRYENGLRFNINALYENRKPLNNTTKYTFFKKDSVHITPNFPYDRISSQFAPHQALIVGFDVSFKPGQKYIQFPDSKMPISSKYPTFTFNYTRGINKVLGSDVDFDKWKFSVYDDVNFRIAGLLKYRVGIGGFLNDKSVFIQDYQHFNGNLTAAASDYVNSFQLVSYYAFSNTAPFFVQAHLEHHFNGLLTNKIPYFRKLNWHLVAGTNTFM